MQERDRIKDLITADREQAYRLNHNPYAKEIIHESQTVIRKAFRQITDKDLDFLQHVSFIPKSDRLAQFGEEARVKNFAIRSLRQNGVEIDIQNINIPYHLVTRDINKNPNGIQITNQDFSNFIPEKVNKNNAESSSKAAVFLFESITDAVLEELSPTIEIETNESLKHLAHQGVRKIRELARNPFDVKLDKIINETDKIIEENENALSFTIKGGAATLLLNGMVLDTFYTNESTVLAFIATENIEDNLINRLTRSKIYGEKWFLKPEDWKKNADFRGYKKESIYPTLLADLKDNNPFRYLISGDASQRFLELNGISFKVKNKNTPEIQTQPETQEEAEQHTEIYLSHETQELIKKYGDTYDEVLLSEEVDRDEEYEIDYGPKFQRLKKGNRKLEQ